MTSKPTAFAFQPAPRPQPRATPEQTRELNAATADLGFGRTTSPPASEPAPAKGATKPSSAPTPKAKAAVASRPAPRAPLPSAPALEPARRSPALKFDVPDAVWQALRHEALNRRVTVKYLVLEALADKGYQVDLSAVPEDGRRLR
jgi:hypothetical protein